MKIHIGVFHRKIADVVKLTIHSCAGTRLDKNKESWCNGLKFTFDGPRFETACPLSVYFFIYHAGKVFLLCSFVQEGASRCDRLFVHICSYCALSFSRLELDTLVTQSPKCLQLKGITNQFPLKYTVVKCQYKN